MIQSKHLFRLMFDVPTSAPSMTFPSGGQRED